MKQAATGTYKTDTTPSEGGHNFGPTSNPLPMAAYDKTGKTWRVTTAEAEEINAAIQKGGKK